MKLLIICMTLLSVCQSQPQDIMKEINKNNMSVKWKIEKDQIHFEMQAPTDGWIDIGFNETTSLTGTYLLMGRVTNVNAEVVEHYTNNPGSYRPIADYGISNQPFSISGNETGKMTHIKFTLPISAESVYHKDLFPGTNWSILMAYSLDDDFQHHSTMRTSVDITL